MRDQRRVVVSFAQAWLEPCRKLNPHSRGTTRKFQRGSSIATAARRACRR